MTLGVPRIVLCLRPLRALALLEGGSEGEGDPQSLLRFTATLICHERRPERDAGAAGPLRRVKVKEICKSTVGLEIINHQRRRRRNKDLQVGLVATRILPRDQEENRKRASCHRVIG